MALSNRLLECLPVACQNPEPRERLALRRGRDDCHFWLHRVPLQGTTGSARAKERKVRRGKAPCHDTRWGDNIMNRQGCPLRSCLTESGTVCLCQRGFLKVVMLYRTPFSSNVRHRKTGKRTTFKEIKSIMILKLKKCPILHQQLVLTEPEGEKKENGH